MQLNINSPAYFSNEYGVDGEIHFMCREISKFMNERHYSEKIETIGIVPIVAPKDLIEQGAWQEEIKYSMKLKLAYVSKQIEFNEYKLASINERKLLIVNNILVSVKAISRKGKLDYARFSKDLLKFLEIDLEIDIRYLS